MRAIQTAWPADIRSWFPTGGGLSDDVWHQRHRAMLGVLWLHLPALAIIGLLQNNPLTQVALEIGLLALGTAAAGLPALSRRARMLLAVITLLSCSAVLIHFTHGLIESHFHFFAAVAFIMLYQEWLPFAVTLAYVVIHHGVVGVIFPHAVYNHQAAWNTPVLWAVIHGGFIMLASLASMASMVSWRLAETERENVQHVLDVAGDGIYGIDDAGRITFVNPTLRQLMGVESTDALLGVHHHEALGHRSEEDVTADRPADTADCALCSAAIRLEPVEGELAFQGASGRPQPVGFVVRPIVKGGRGQGSVITVRDLREQRALDLQRRRLSAEKGRLASIVEASPNPAAVAKADGTMIWMNAAGKRMLGFAPDEDMSRHRIDEQFSAQERERVFTRIMPKIVEEGHWQGEWSLQAQNGIQVPVAVSAHRHQGLDDEGFYLSAVMQDLRPQQAQKRAIRQGVDRVANAETIARMGSWEWDLGGNSVKWSKGLYQLYGMPQGSGEEPFDKWLATVHPDDQARAIELSSQMLNGTGKLDFVYRGFREDGTPLVLHSRGERVEEHGGPVILGTVLDITERHAALEALKRSEELARRIIESAGEAYVQCGPDGVVTEWNVQAENTFGWSRAEALGQQLAWLIAAPAEREGLEAQLGVAGASREAHPRTDRFNHAMTHRSGAIFPAEVTAWTTTAVAGTIYSCLIRDVSERHAAERAKDEFVAVVGHELRTPLTSIHGALGLLRAGLLGELNERGRQMVDIAAHNTDRLVRLINDILDIERLNSGKAALELQESDIAVLAGRSVEVMRPMAEAAGVELLTDVEPCTVWVDPDRIEQTLTNLLSNAIKFSSPGSEVQVVATMDGSAVTLQVRDQGRGIPAEDLERIFDRFQQVDGSDARDKGGTGLGLAICRTIVEQHGGRIWAESGTDRGSTFSLTLPAAPPLEGLVEPEGPAVLIGSEDAIIRRSILAMLLHHGYAPLEVPSPTEVLDAAVRHRPAVILLEQQTASLSAWDVATALRGRAETRDIPVVFLSLKGGTAVPDLDGVSHVEELDPDALLGAVEEAVAGAKTRPRLLLVEDDESLAAILTERFRQMGLEVHHASTARHALAICAHIVPQVLVLDLQLPDQDGYAVVAQLRRDARLRGMPLAVYSAHDLTEADRKRLRLGETEFFTKGRVSPEEFERHVINLLGHLITHEEEQSHA